MTQTEIDTQQALLIEAERYLATRQAVWKSTQLLRRLVDSLRAAHAVILKADAGAAALRPWLPIETLPEGYEGQFVVFWQQSSMGNPTADMMGSWQEYQQVLSFGEPPATHWMKVTPPADPGVTR